MFDSFVSSQKVYQCIERNIEKTMTLSRNPTATAPAGHTMYFVLDDK